MIDHYVPHPDEDAGSRAVFQYVELFVDSTGVDLPALDLRAYGHYTTALQQLGVEVLYGPTMIESLSPCSARPAPPHRLRACAPAAHRRPLRRLLQGAGASGLQITYLATDVTTSATPPLPGAGRQRRARAARTVAEAQLDLFREVDAVHVYSSYDSGPLASSSPTGSSGDCRLHSRRPA